MRGSGAGKCPATPAAPLPGNVSQNIFAGNFLTSCRKFLSSYILECHIIYLLFKNFKSILQLDIVDITLILKFTTMQAFKSQGPERGRPILV